MRVVYMVNMAADCVKLFVLTLVRSCRVPLHDDSEFCQGHVQELQTLPIDH